MHGEGETCSKPYFRDTVRDPSLSRFDRNVLLCPAFVQRLWSLHTSRNRKQLQIFQPSFPFPAHPDPRCSEPECRVRTYPNPGLGEVGPDGDLLPGGHVRVAIPLEGGLQLLQLLAGEVSPLSPLPLLLGGVLGPRILILALLALILFCKWGKQKTKTRRKTRCASASSVSSPAAGVKRVPSAAGSRRLPRKRLAAVMINPRRPPAAAARPRPAGTHGRLLPVEQPPPGQRDGAASPYASFLPMCIRLILPSAYT